MSSSSDVHFPSVLAREFGREDALRLLALRWAIARGAESYGNTRPMKTVMAEAAEFLAFLRVEVPE